MNKTRRHWKHRIKSLINDDTLVPIICPTLSGAIEIVSESPDADNVDMIELDVTADAAAVTTTAAASGWTVARFASAASLSSSSLFLFSCWSSLSLLSFATSSDVSSAVTTSAVSTTSGVSTTSSGTSFDSEASLILKSDVAAVD